MRLTSVLPSLFLASFIDACPLPPGPASLARPRGVPFGRRSGAEPCGKCDLSKIKLPQAPLPLPLPSGKIQDVVLGLGTQNYSCKTNSSTSSRTPVPVGAVATLFNVTCLSADSPDLVAALPNIALNQPVPSRVKDDASTPGSFGISGHHYFLDTSTPFFDLDTAQHSYGQGAFKKFAVSDAPSDALAGPNNKGNGAVPWLLLKTASTYDGQQSFSEVYRVMTAGGAAPKTCTEQQDDIQIKYAALYFFFS